MSDNIDIANEIMQDRIDHALNNRIHFVNKVSAIECVECGFDIPEARRYAIPGTQHCVECARILEEQRQFKGN